VRRESILIVDCPKRKEARLITFTSDNGLTHVSLKIKGIMDYPEYFCRNNYFIDNIYIVTTNIGFRTAAIG
jgi:hypothetical protein